MPSVYLSHAHRDSDLASLVGRCLADAGIKVFDPNRDVPRGASWRDAVKGAMSAADALVIVVGSPDAAASSWIAYEAGAADARGIPVIILASHNFPQSELPIDLLGYAVVPVDPEQPTSAVRLVQQSLRATA